MSGLVGWAMFLNKNPVARANNMTNPKNSMALYLFALLILGVG